MNDPDFQIVADPFSAGNTETLYSQYMEYQQRNAGQPGSQPEPERTAFQRGYVNYADGATTPSVKPPYLNGPYDLMTLDPDPYGQKTEAWVANLGANPADIGVGGLMVFGKAFSREELERSDAGRQLLEYARKNREGVRRGFLEAITDVSWSDLPFIGMFAAVGGSIFDAATVANTMKKLQNGDPVTDEELIKTRLYLAKQEYEARGSWGALVGDIVRQAPGFMAEMFITGGVGSAARIGTGVVAARGASALAKKAASEGAEAVAKGAVERAAGGAVRWLTKTADKRLAQELAEEELGKAVAGKLGKVTGDAFAEGVRNLGKDATDKITADLAKSMATRLRMSLASDTGAIFGIGKNAVRKFAGDDALIDAMAESLATRSMKRAVAKLGATTKYRRFGHALTQKAKDWTVGGILDLGTFGTTRSTVLFGGQNSAGNALVDALGTLLVEAPVRGAMQYGFNLIATSPLRLSGAVTSEQQLALQAAALQTGNRDLMEKAKWISMGLEFMEYASENTGQGFGSLFRSAGLATGVVKPAERAFVGSAGGLILEAPKREHGGFLRSFIRKATGTVDDARHSTADARAKAVLRVVNDEADRIAGKTGAFSRISEAKAARIAAGDLTGVTDDALHKFVGDDAGKFVKRAVKEAIDKGELDDTYRTYFRYVMADIMARHNFGPDEALDAFEKMGYDGIVEEMLEERYNDFAQGLFGWDDKNNQGFGAHLRQAFENLFPGWDQLTAEAVGFAIPMVARVAAVNAQRWAGTPTEVSRYRAIARSGAEALSGTPVAEVSVGALVRHYNTEVERLTNEIDELKGKREQTITEADAAGIDTTDRAEKRRLLSSIDAQIKEKASMLQAQTDARARTLAANGLPTDVTKLSEEDLARIISSPVISADTKSGDLEKDKLRPDLTSEQAGREEGRRQAFVNGMWELGRAASKKGRGGPGKEGSLKQFTAKAIAKITGIAAAVLTAEPALAFRNYASWAAVDEGLDKHTIDEFVRLHDKHYDTARNAIIAERAEAAKKEGGADEGTTYQVSEEEIWQRMEKDYKKAAADLAEKVLVIHGVQMFSQREMLSQAVAETARRNGWTFHADDGTFTRTENGDERTLTFNGFYTEFQDEVDPLRDDIADATLTLLGQGRGATRAFIRLPSDSPEKARVAMTLAMQMAGFSAAELRTVRVSRGDDVASEVAKSAVRLSYNVLQRVADAADKGDTVDYSAPSEEDIIEIASVLRIPVADAITDEERDAVRRKVVDLARQYAAVGRAAPDAIVYEAMLPEDDPRVRGLSDRKETVRFTKGSDNKWHSNRTFSIDGTSQYLTFDTEEDIEKAMTTLGLGFSRRHVSNDDVLIVDVGSVETDDGLMLVQQFGFTEEYIERTRRSTTKGESAGGAKYDYSYVHPLFRRNVDGSYVYKTYEEADAQFRREVMLAELYSRHGSDVSRYPAKVSEGSKPEVARERLMKEAKAAHDHVYGENGYITVMNQLLADHNVTTPKSASLYGFATGSRPVYVTGIGQFTKDARAVIPIDYTKAEDYSSAFAKALLQTAFINRRWLLRSDGNWAKVAGDFAHCVEDAARAALYSPDTSVAQKAALRDVIKNVTVHADNMTIDALCELAVSFPMFMVERDRDTGYSSSPRTIAYQAIAHEVYNKVQFLKFFGLVDLMLGGDGFSIELLSRRERAGVKPAPRGVERYMALFHGEAGTSLKKAVSEIKPCGYDFNGFVHNVNELARKVMKATPEKVEPVSRDSSPFSFFSNIRRAFAVMGDKADGGAVLNLLSALPNAVRQDADLRKTVESKAQEFRGWHENVQARINELTAKIAELSNDKKNAGKLNVANQTKAELEAELAELNTQIEKIERELRERTYAEELRKAVEAGGEAGELGKVNVGRETPASKDTVVEPTVETPTEDVEEETEEDDEKYRVVVGDRVDDEAVVRLDVGSDGAISIKEIPVTVTDLDDTSRLFATSIVRAVIDAVGGATDTEGNITFDSYLWVVDKLFPTMPYEEKQRIYDVYKTRDADEAEARKARLAEGAQQQDEADDEGIGTDADRGFGDKALAAYQDETLAQFLKFAAFAMPTAGRNLQAFLNNVRDRLEVAHAEVEAKRLAAGPNWKPSTRDRAIEATRRLMNPRALLYIDTKENRELASKIEALDRVATDTTKPDRERKSARSSADALRVKLYSSTSATDREAEWRRVMNNIDGGIDGLTYDMLINGLLRGEPGVSGDPACRNMAFLLAFIKGLSKPMRLRLMNLCANSAMSTRTRITNRTEEHDIEEAKPVAEYNEEVAAAEAAGIDPLTISKVKVTTVTENFLELDTKLDVDRLTPSTAMSDSFSPLSQMTKEDIAKRAREVEGRYKAAVEAGEFKTLDIERYEKDDATKRKKCSRATDVLEHNMKVLTRVLSPLFGAETAVMQVLSSGGFALMLDDMCNYVMRGMGNGARLTVAQGALLQAAIDSSPNFFEKGGVIPRFTLSKDEAPRAPLYSQLMSAVEAIIADATPRDGETPRETRIRREHSTTQICLTAFTVGLNRNDTMKVASRTAKVKPSWDWLMNMFIAAQPVTVTPAELLPDREAKTMSSVAVSSRGVIAGIQRWMDLPLSDKNGFAYVAKNLLGGRAGDRLRSMSDAEFLRDVLPMCRQTMTWPDAYHTPILAKNISRSYTPNEVYKALQNRFIKRTLRNESLVSGPAIINTGNRWYYQLFAGDHSSATLIQFPNTRLKPGDGSMTLGVQLDKSGDPTAMFKKVSDRVSNMIGMEMIAKDPKRSSLMSNDAPGVALCGTRLANDGTVERGESRVHLIFNFSTDFLEAGGDAKKQEAMKGTVIGRGYGYEQSRLTAGDPLSRVIKAHIMSSSGHMLSFFKGLVSVVGGPRNGQFSKGSIERVLADYLDTFRKGDRKANITTDTALDGDAYKVGHGRSATAGVEYSGPEGATRVSLFQYISDKLARADIPAGGLDLTALDAILGDNAVAPDGADADDYRLGTFTWVDEAGRKSRVTIADLMGARNPDGTTASDSGVVVRVVQGKKGDQSGYLVDFSYVDNSLQAYTVANVSHVANDEAGRMPRNYVTDALTLASGLIKSGQIEGSVRDSVKDILEQLASWGIVAATVASDPTSAAAIRNEAASESLQALLEKGESPEGLNAEQQVAYDLFKRLTKLLSFPMNKVDCALVSGGAVYDSKRGVVVDHSVDPFLRLMHQGSRVYSKAEMSWRGVPRSLGLGQINVTDDAFRYGWHLDRKAFAVTYDGIEGIDAVALERLPARTLCEVLQKLFEEVHDADTRVEGLFRAGKEKQEELKAALKEARALRDQLTRCFVDHNGQRISDLKCHFEQHKRHLSTLRKSNNKETEEESKYHNQYRYSVCFDDLFIAGAGNERVFDRSAFFFGNPGYRLDRSTCEAPTSDLNHVVTDQDPIFLAGTTFGFPRTPSYNGSMWAQTMRAFSPVTTDVAEDGAIISGRDAYVAPDPQSMYILGCDNDGDKAQCYMFRGNPMTGTTSYQLLHAPTEETTDGVTRVDLSTDSYFNDPELRKRYLYELVEEGVLTPPMKRADDVVSAYRVNQKIRGRVSNQFVQSLFDLSHWLPCSNEGTEKNFADTEFARPTKPQPLGKAAMERLIKVADRRANFLEGSTLEDSWTGANVMTSSRSADRARGMAVSLAMVLHFAQMSGRFDDTLFRGWPKDGDARLKAWIDFIYHIDGISNATFDDIKEQICLRLGWTNGMLDTLLVDIMTHGEKTPTTDEEFLEALMTFTSSVSGVREKIVNGVYTYEQGPRGSRYYMLNTSNPADDNEEGVEMKGWVRRFFRPLAKRKKAAEAKARGKDYTPSGVFKGDVEGFFGFHYQYNKKGVLVLVRGDHDTEVDPRVTEFLNAVDNVVANSEKYLHSRDEDARDGMLSRAYRNIVSAISRRRGVNTGSGYVYWLFTEGALKTHEGSVQQEVADFMKWLNGTVALGEARQVANAVNFTKADPGDSGKVSRQFDNLSTLDKIMEKGSNGDTDVQDLVDRVFYTMSMSTRLVYQVGSLATIPTRAGLAAELRGEAIIRTAETVQGAGVLSQEARDLVIALFAGDALVPSYQLKQIQDNLQTLPYFIATLRRMKPVIAGSNLLYGPFDEQWGMMNKLACQEGTFGLLASISSIFRVLYYLSSTDLTPQDCSAFYLLNGTNQRAWDKTIGRYDSEIGQTVRTPVYAKEGLEIARITPNYAEGDSMGRQLARLLVARAAGFTNGHQGSLDTRKRHDGLRKRNAELANTGIDTFCLSADVIEKLIKFSGKEQNVSPEVMKDVLRLKEVFENLPEGTVIAPSTFWRQLLPLYAALTQRATAAMNPMSLMPDYYKEISDEQAFLFSGVLEPQGRQARPGLSVWDAACGTDIAPFAAGKTDEADAVVLPTEVSKTEKNKIIADLVNLDEKEREKVRTNLSDNKGLRETREKLRPTDDNPHEESTSHLLDVLSPTGLVKSLHKFTLDMASVQTDGGQIQPTSAPLTDEERVDAGIQDPRTRKIVSATRALVAHWATVEYRGGNTFVIRSKGGLNGAGAMHFGMGNGTAAAITVHVGRDPLVNAAVDFDVNSAAFAASFCEQTKGLLGLDVEDFMNLTYEERKALVTRYLAGGGSLADSNFSLSKPSWTISAEGLRVLSGQIYVGDSTVGSFYHEYFHSMIGMFRTMGLFTDADVKAFVKRYGKVRPGVDELFDEERAAEEFREYVEHLNSGETAYEKVKVPYVKRGKREKGKLRKGEGDAKVEADKGVATVFKRLYNACKAFLNAITEIVDNIAAGFSHSEATSSTFLFDMVITGYAAESVERAQEYEDALVVRRGIAADLQKAGASEEAVLREYEKSRLASAKDEKERKEIQRQIDAYKAEQGRKAAAQKTFIGEGGTLQEAKKNAEAASYERFGKIVEGMAEKKSDPMEGYVIPTGSLEASAHSVLIEELIDFTHPARNAAVKQLLRLILDARGRKAHDKRTKMSRIVAGRPTGPQLTAEDTIRMKVGVALAKDPMAAHIGPDVYAPVFSLGRAIANEIAGKGTNVERNILDAVAQRMPQTQKLLGEARIRGFALDYSTLKDKVERVENVARTAVQTYLRLNGTINEEELAKLSERERNAMRQNLVRIQNRAYLALLSARGDGRKPGLRGIAAKSAATKTQAYNVAEGKNVSAKHSLSAADYVGFLMACGQQRPQDYITALKARVASARATALRANGGDEGARLPKIAAHILKALEKFDGFDVTTMLADPTAWNAMCDEFFPSMFRGLIRGPYNDTTRAFGPYTMAAEAVDEIAEENQKLYQLGGADSKGDEIVQQLLADVADTMYAVAASVKFYRELGIQPGTYTHQEILTKESRPPVSEEEILNALHIGASALQDESDIVRRDLQDSFVLTNIDKWLEATLPRILGNDDIKETMMRASREFRGCISTMTNDVNFLMMFFGISDPENRKLLKLIVDKSHFEMHDGGWTAVDWDALEDHEGDSEEEKARKAEARKRFARIGFDRAGGVLGKRDDVAFDLSEYRMVDLLMKVAAVKASGGTRFVTGVDGIRFYGEGGIPSRESILPRDLRDEGYTFNDLYDPEKVKKIYDRYNTSASSREIPPFIMALWRIGHQLDESVWGKDDGKGYMNLYRRFVAAVGTALDELERTAEEHLDSTHTLMTPAQCNDYLLRTLQTAGFIVAQEAERQEEKSLYTSLEGAPLVSEGVLTFDIGEFDTMYRKSSAREKLVKAGRDIPVGEDGMPDPTIPSGKSTRSMLDLDYIVEMLMRDWNRLRDKVKEHPWLTKGDGAMFNNFDTPLPFFQGTGMFMYHANRLARDTKTEQTVKLGKHEATFLDMCGNPSLQSRPVSDVSVPMLLMLHDYYNTQETGYELRDAIMNGKYAKGSRAAGVTGLELAPDSTFLDIAAAVYRKQVDMRLRTLEGRSVESFVDGNDAITRMIAAWENSGRGENVMLAGGMGLTDEQMYRLHGVLPANMQIGHKMLVAAKNVTNALYSRSVLINMMFTKGYEGNPVYYLNPAVFAVDSGGVPDSVWASAAKWWVSRNKGLKYDPRLSGVENARSIYAALSTKAKSGMINGRKFQTLSGDELQDHASIDGVLCQADDPSDESKSKLAKLAGRNILTLDGGTALGYAKHFFQTTRVPNGAKLAWMDHTLAWMKALNVSCSFFFPIATKWESPVAAVGTMATFFSNVAPDFARKHHKGINAIQQALTLGLSEKLGGMPADWLNENFIGFKDIIEMMDTNDPFLADLIMWAESLGISMSTTLHNPAEEGRGYVERDIKRFSDAVRSRVGGKAAAAIGATLEAIALRSGEKAFTYALNATKLAVTCQIAMKLRAQAMRAHRAFDPIRDLAKYAAYIDSEIGGVDPLRYAWAHPRMQQLLSRTLFSWQWTRTAWEAGGGPILEDLIFGGHTLNKETRRYILGRWLRMYGTVMIGIPMLAQLAIKGLALAFGRDDDDDKWFTWENEEKVGMSAYDITPLMKVCAMHEPVARVISGALAGLYGGMKLGVIGAIGGALIGAAKAPVYSGSDESNRTTKNRRYYMHFGKQGWEFFRWFDSPGQQLLSKQNMFLQRLEEGLFGRSLSYLERAQPWEDQSAVERWLYPTMDSAWANMLKAFMPFTMSGMSTFGDAGFLPAFGPVQMGTSQTSLIKRMEKRMSAWANNERAAYPFAGKHGKSRGKEVQHGVLGDLYEEARRNGFAVPEELAMRAIGKITPRIYGQLFEELDKDSFDDIDQKAVRRLVRKIQRLGGTYKTAKASFEKRMKTMGINFDKLPQERRDMFTIPTKAAFTNPFDDGYDVAMPVDY